MKIGVLSDTHGLLRPEVLEALAGCEAILHGGDIDRPGVLERLAALAPTYAVRGNADKEWAEKLPLVREITLAGTRICMAHKKKDLPANQSDYDLVIFGHSHRYETQTIGHTLLLNPGSCGPRRFHLPVTLAIVEANEGKIAVTRMDFAPDAPPLAPANGPNIKAQIKLIMRETEKGRGPGEIAKRHGLEPAFAEQIARLYVTHPGVTADGIMAKLGL